MTTDTKTGAMWVLVPREPTEESLECLKLIVWGGCWSREALLTHWENLLETAAAPPPPSEKCIQTSDTGAQGSEEMSNITYRFSTPASEAVWNEAIEEAADTAESMREAHSSDIAAVIRTLKRQGAGNE